MESVKIFPLNDSFFKNDFPKLLSKKNILKTSPCKNILPQKYIFKIAILENTF